LVIGFGVLGMGPNPQSPIPNPQSPIPNPPKNCKLIVNYINYYIIMINLIISELIKNFKIYVYDLIIKNGIL
jgi:hypothetical protein